jgi:hypothetical protein
MLSSSFAQENNVRYTKYKDTVLARSNKIKNSRIITRAKNLELQKKIDKMLDKKWKLITRAEEATVEYSKMIFTDVKTFTVRFQDI